MTKTILVVVILEITIILKLVFDIIIVVAKAFLFFVSRLIAKIEFQIKMPN